MAHLHRPPSYGSPAQVAARAAGQGEPPHRLAAGELRRTWFRAVTAGELIGFCVPAAVALLAFRYHPGVILVAMTGAGVFEGLVLGAAQARVLRRELVGFSRPDWAMATAVAAGVAWFLGMLPSTFSTTWRDWPSFVGVVLGVLLLASIGLAQSLVLRRYVARAWRWLLVTALAWSAGLLVFAGVTGPLWREGQSLLVAVGVAVLGSVAMAATTAWLTGWFLVRILLDTRGAGCPPPMAPAQEWAMLGESTDRYQVFSPDLVKDLPAPVRRWLRHSIAPGACLLTAADVEMRGNIRMGRVWRPLRAWERIALGGGFVWAARTRLAGLPLDGFDRFTRGGGEMHWRLLGRVSVMSSDDEVVTRSAATRYAGELLAFAPAAALSPAVTWVEVDDMRARALVDVGGRQERITITVDRVGRLRQMEMRRWGTPPDAGFGLYRFGAVFDDEGCFDGYRLPTQVTAGWHFGTAQWPDGRFLRYRLTRVSFG